MKGLQIFAAALLVAVFVIPAADAQSLKGMSLNGSTGLISIPSGKIGWEGASNLGIDLGYHVIFKDGHASNIPKLGISLFKWVELSAAFDMQPNHFRTIENGTDFIGGIKIQFPLKNTALSLGGNFQAHNMGNDTGHFLAGQVYAAVTYAGQFFKMPAETTVVLGKSLREDSPNWDIDFGMGFDLILLPDVFDHFIHWVTDFANFSYSAEAFGADSGYRGVLNTGFRIDLAAIPALSKFKFVVDFLVTDAFDDARAISLGAVFGIPVL